MRQIKEILRLKYQHQLSVRAIARSCGLSRSTVGDYLQRAKAAGLNWPFPEELSEAQLLERLLGVAQAQSSNQPPRPLPQWPKVHHELRRPKVTLQLVWQEYHETHPPQGYGYSRFGQLYQRWACTLEPSLRQSMCPGKRCLSIGLARPCRFTEQVLRR